MTPERWARAAELYESALAVDAAARAAFLADACRDDSGLRREVESLLAQDQEAILWIRDLTDTGSSMRQLTFTGRNRFPVWSPDGEWIAFQSDRDGDLGMFRQRADGTGMAERLTKADPDTSHIPESWSPNGRHLLFSVATGPIVVGTQRHSVSLHAYSFDSRTSAPFGDVTSVTPLTSAFSPDGRWVAYTPNHSRASGGFDVYVEPFPSTGTKYRVTDNGTSRNPLWSPDGKALFYRPSAAQLAMVAVAFQPTVRFGTPSTLPRPFVEAGPIYPRNYDITPDGQFLALVEVEQGESGDPAGPRINVVLNWFEELKQRVPVQ